MKPPIAEPRATPPADEAELSFRLKFWPYFLANTAFIVIFSFPLVGATLFPDFARRPRLFTLIMAGVMLFILALTFVLCLLTYYLMPVRLTEQTLSGVSVWGARREVEWAQITRVKRGWVLIPCAIISTASEQKVWIYLSVENEAGFRRAVANFAAPDNPLLLLLESRARGS